MNKKAPPGRPENKVRQVPMAPPGYKARPARKGLRITRQYQRNRNRMEEYPGCKMAGLCYCTKKRKPV